MAARSLSVVAIAFLGAVVGSACAMEKLGTGTGSGTGGAAGDGGSDAATVTGAGCGAERQTGLQLCIATSQCPNVVVDTQAMPSCGFRIRGSVVDLVCACGGSSICPMGIFTTCAQAAKLLQTQTEQQVCLQVSEGRCVEANVQTGSSSSSSGSSKNPACDRECMTQCGGGAACASICNCD